MSGKISWMDTPQDVIQGLEGLVASWNEDSDEGVYLSVSEWLKQDGDTVRAGGEMGSVVEIGLFTTLLDTPDNRRLVVPNRSVFNGNIENVSFHARRRIDLDIGVGYEADLDATRAALEAAAAAVEGRLEDPAPVIVLNGLGASAVNWQVRVWAPTPAFLAVRQAALRQIKRTLDEQGLSIPFPQMDVHLRREAANGG